MQGTWVQSLVQEDPIGRGATKPKTAKAPLSMGFSRQEYWSGLPCPPPGDLLNAGIEPGSPALQAWWDPQHFLGTTSIGPIHSNGFLFRWIRGHEKPNNFPGSPRDSVARDSAPAYVPHLSFGGRGSGAWAALSAFCRRRSVSAVLSDSLRPYGL